MPKAKFYAVAAGRKPGIYNSWSECEQQVKGFKGAKFKSFTNKSAAEEYIQFHNTAPLSATGSKREAVPLQQTKNSKRPRHLPKHSYSIHVNFDGGSRGNPGRSGAGAAILIRNQTLSTRVSIHLRHYVGHKATNNQAEYHGLIEGLTLVAHILQELYKNVALCIECVIQGDSDLIIQQLNRSYKCNSPLLKPLYQQATNLISQIGELGDCSIVLEHVYRDANQQADALANQAMDSQRNWLTTSLDDHQSQLNKDQVVAFLIESLQSKITTQTV